DTLFNPPLYPRLHLLPDGRVFYSMSDVTLTSRFFDVSTQVWSTCCHTVSNNIRVYGTAVLLPLSPTNNYSPSVMIMGGGQFDTTTHSTKTTELINLNPSILNPHWVSGPDMSQPRIQVNSTILPSGRVLVTGGSDLNEDLNSVSFNADLYDPVSNSFSSAGMNAVPRLYHSNALLLRDATVLVFGNNHPPAPFSPYDPRVELYKPAYLFKADGTMAPRPVITGVPAGAIGYNSVFQVTTPDATSISSVILVRPAGVTHAFNMEQRLIKLNFSVSTSGTGILDVTAPPNGNVAPPGYYMLFILNSTNSATSTGTPSVAKFVQICPASGCL
ncbi:MAG: galactose oxidase early set domain-containing protein, partial [Candidatus Angelobacter sp.]